MDERSARVAEVLHDAAETHHIVYKITDGTDADWATWYADWLLRLSPLPELLGAAPVRSELVYWLVRCDKEHSAGGIDAPWEEYYAGVLLQELGKE